MAKTNFTKVEKALDEGLHQIEVEHLLDEADANSGKVKSHLLTQEQQVAILQTLDREVRKLYKNDTEVYKKIGFARSHIKRLITNPQSLKPEDWKKIKEIKDKIELYKKELSEQIPHSSDDKIVEEERIKHVNKRFNIKDTWLPLK